MIKITIITATYNSEDTLEYTIRSVIEQTYPDIEYIIIDGASTDKTIGIIKKYNNYDIKYISEPDNGLYDALNKGIRMATGDYVYVLGSDDVLSSSHIISTIVKKIDKNIDVLSGRVMLVNESNNKTFVIDNKVQRYKKTYRGGNPPHQGIFVRRELFKKYTFDVSYKIAADYKLFLQLYYDECVQIKYIDDIVAFFASGGISGDTRMIDEESNRIYSELKLPFHSPTSNGDSKKIRLLKKILWKLNIYYLSKKTIYPIVSIIRNAFFLDKHRCDNSLCRWCGRNEL